VLNVKVVIIGGVATGPKVAARLRRLSPEADITVIDKGSIVSYGSCGLPLFLGNLVPKIEDLRKTSAGLVRDTQYFDGTKGIKVLTQTEALAIDRAKKKVKVRSLEKGEVWELDYDYLVLATGTKEVKPPIPGLEAQNVFTVRHLDAAAQIRDLIREKKVKHATIIGAGLIGIEVADALNSPRLKVMLCESQPRVLAKLLDPDIALLVEDKMLKRGVDLRLNCRVQKLEKDEEGKVCGVVINDEKIATDLVIVAVGGQPEVALAREAGLTIGETGAIQVNQRMQTDDPFIYAGGDCVEQINTVTGHKTFVPLASTANKQGRVIADNIAGIPSEFPAISATTAFQAFDLKVGRTGLGEAQAKELGFEVLTSISTGLDAAHFYPVHGAVTLKLIAEKATGRLLGAQVCGIGEAIKRLDVLATVLKFKGTIKDIQGLDLSYAPPFATAIDVLIHAANTWENKQKGVVETITPFELMEMLNRKENITLVDVREPEETKANPVQGANTVVIPLGELRKRYQEIPQDSHVITVCELGIRGYDAACFLQSKFPRVGFLEGGMSTWGALGYKLGK